MIIETIIYEDNPYVFAKSTNDHPSGYPHPIFKILIYEPKADFFLEVLDATDLLMLSMLFFRKNHDAFNIPEPFDGVADEILKAFGVKRTVRRRKRADKRYYDTGFIGSIDRLHGFKEGKEDVADYVEGFEVGARKKQLLCEILESCYYGKYTGYSGYKRDDVISMLLELPQSLDTYMETVMAYIDQPHLKFPKLYDCLNREAYDELEIASRFIQHEIECRFEKIRISDIIRFSNGSEVWEIKKSVNGVNINRGKRANNFEAFLAEYKPHTIVSFLDEYIIGQEDAKKAAATMLYIHVLRLAHPELELKKENILVWGASGCGKTEIFRILQKIAPRGVYIHILNACDIPSVGFTGGNINDKLFALGRNNRVETSIIVLDI